MPLVEVPSDHDLTSIQSTRDKISNQLLQDVFEDTLYDFELKTSDMIADIQAGVVEQMIKTKVSLSPFPANPHKRQCDTLFSQARLVPMLEKRIKDLEEQNARLKSAIQARKH